MTTRFSVAGVLALALASPAYSADIETAQQSAIIEEDPLLARLSALEAKIDALETRNAELETRLSKTSEQAGKSNRIVPTFTSEDKQTSFKVRGVVDVDYAAFNERRGGYDFNNGTAFRRARIGFEGTAFNDFDWRIEADFAGNNVNLQDAYIQYKAIRDLRLTLGQHKAPFGLESNNSDNYNVFLEKGIFHSAAGGLGAERKIGFSAAYLKDDFTFSAGIFGENESITRGGSDTAAHDEGWGFNARATWEPINKKGQILHLGASTYWRTSLRAGSSAGVRLNERPNIRVDNGNIIDSGVIADADTAFYAGAEGAAIFGPVTLAGEYGRLSIDRTAGQPSADFDGFYVYGAWFLTGESRPFRRGNYDRVSPTKNFDGKNGWGAWEVAIRYDEADLSDTPIITRSGNKAQSWTAGLNWYWNPNMKLQFNYIRFKGTNTPLDPIGTRTAGDAFATRLHLDW